MKLPKTQQRAQLDDGSDEGMRHHAGNSAERRGTNEPAPRRISTMARAGFVVVFIVTLAAAVSLDLLSPSPGYGEAPWAPWLIASLLGSAAMGILVSAEDAIHRKWESGSKRWFVTAAIVPALVGVYVLAFILSGLAELLAAGL